MRPLPWQSGVRVMGQVRRAIYRLGILLALSSLVCLLPQAPAEAAKKKPVAHHVAPWTPRYAAILIDADTGEVLHQVDPDQQSYPASLTKMMTLYLLFERLATGKVNFDTTFVTSQHASVMEPSKLSLRPGQSVRVEDLLFGVVTKSANDAAVVIAEGLDGSEAAFAAEMTATAQRLGMHHTHFANASGLPNPENISTARDMATLGRALIRDFPRYYGYFDTRQYSFKGQQLINHNHMLGAYDGLDGIKTGFIHASGFNLVASAKRDGRRLVGAVFGGTSAVGRDRIMAQLLDAGFDNRASEIQFAGLPAGAHRMITQSAVEQGDAEDTAPAKPVAVKKTVVLAKPAHVQVAAKSDAQAKWAVQVGAFRGASQARAAAQHAISGAHGDLAHGHVQVVKNGKMHRARVTGLTQQQAHDACRVLEHKGSACVTIGPDVQA
jgi:D-alanyl-D-alanine carboxypeptidase